MDLRTAVENARRPDVHTAVRALYDDLGREIDARKPRCDASGRCCHFDAYGHRLYLTTAELATFVTDITQAAPEPSPTPPGRSLPILKPSTDGGGDCPYQVDELCSVHALRPFGCRIYFCDPAATEWMTDAYERFHLRLKTIHADHGLEYFYVEWRQALRDLDLPRPR